MENGRSELEITRKKGERTLPAWCWNRRGNCTSSPTTTASTFQRQARAWASSRPPANIARCTTPLAMYAPRRKCRQNRTAPYPSGACTTRSSCCRCVRPSNSSAGPFAQPPRPESTTTLRCSARPCGPHRRPPRAPPPVHRAGQPVTEAGRSTTTTTAVVEPPSMRSLIQLAGRVWRHWPGAGWVNMVVLGQQPAPHEQNAWKLVCKTRV